MSFNIQTFLSQTNQSLAREAHFEMMLNPPSSVKGSAQSINLLCTSAQQPNRRIETNSTKRLGYGIDMPYATGTNFSNLDLMFYCDASGNILELLQSWINLVMPSYSGSGAMLLNYHDSYIGQGTLTQFGQDGGTIMTTTFKDIFPVSVGPINFSWAATDSLVLVPASFAYTYYSTTNPVNFNTNNLSISQQPSQITNLPATGITIL